MANNAFDQPGNLGAVLADFSLSQVFTNWISRVHAICTANQQSGETANRPVKGVWLGRRYWDTDLGIPVYVASYSAGVVSWVDSTGAPA